MGLIFKKLMVLEATRACNYACPNCGADAGTPLDKELTKDEIFSLLDRARPDYLAITGGEPLLREDIFEIIDRARRYATVRLNTNGSLMTKSAAERLNADQIFISVDALPAGNAALRGEQNFGDVLAALDNLEAAGKLNRVLLLITASKRNAAGIPETIKYFSPRIRNFGIGKLVPVGRAGKDLLLTRRETAALYFRLLPLRLKSRIHFFYEFGELLKIVRNDLTVLADGTIARCCLVRKPLGSIRTAERLPRFPKYCLLCLSGCAECRRLR